jgi:cardiolipin-specific phospholipase
MKPCRARKMLVNFINNDMPIQDPAELACMREYLFQILCRPSETSKGFYVQLDVGLHAHVPLDSEDQLRNPDLNFPISFIYGENDWMDSRGSREIVKANKFFSTGESQLHILENAGHQLFMNNTKGFIALMIADLTGNLRHMYQPKPYSVMYVDN